MNKLTKYACILTTLAGAVACSGGKKAQGDYAIIPLPQEVALLPQESLHEVFQMLLL